MRRVHRPPAAIRAWLAALVMLALDACRTLPVPAPRPWPEQRAALQALERYQFRGQLAAATASEGFSAALSWQQRGVASDAQLRAPLGVGGAHFRYDEGGLQMTASSGAALSGAAAHETMVGMLGFEPPLASLRYWLLGVPDPAAPAVELLDTAQHLQRLTQGDWQIDYGDYAPQGSWWLPGLVTLRREDARLKVRIRRWQLQ
jgi:outer membrane lipoprotein LolB